MYFFETYANLIGIIGVFFVLVAYLLLQIDWLLQDSITYSVMNMFGSSLILISLYYYWNFPSGVIEIAWFLISLLGTIKAIIKYNKKKKAVYD